ncbi:phosphatase PAP2 family protein [Streptomyces sp. H10-C2]|uniref:phosphatase PAP2 family protein n=1 Tax=unclassified Streptomyces TaxID=2593676 RepID=UPI0024B8A397|nr:MULTISPECIES: phosphatase PAP2 family protein [unclassified Streptomyces]MDJ0341751.1 phosphatase PAP2 family protein [Streptomyces sp. PH10-H1]MDJ0368941.1 phosphatase PAP2 family protein [Streptomyces sp. H10-C2]
MPAAVRAPSRQCTVAFAGPDLEGSCLMTVASPVTLAFDGSHIDGSWFTTVTDFARHTAWLNGTVEAWTNLGLGVFALLMVAGWWSARRRDADAMTLALAAPVCVMVAFAVAEVVKKVVAEVRPCRSLPHAYIVDACPAPGDYAFPSGHTTVAAATVAALFVLDRRLSLIAAVFAVLEGFTRVYVGAHYPHDVAGSAVIALPVALAVSLVLRRFAAPLVASLSAGRLRPLLSAAAADAGAGR